MTKVFQTKRAAKAAAQDHILSQIGNALGYWTEMMANDYERMSEDERAEFRAVLQDQADRVARMFGYEKAWSN